MLNILIFDIIIIINSNNMVCSSIVYKAVYVDSMLNPVIATTAVSTS